MLNGEIRNEQGEILLDGRYSNQHIIGLSLTYAGDFFIIEGYESSSYSSRLEPLLSQFKEDEYIDLDENIKKDRVEMNSSNKLVRYSVESLGNYHSYKPLNSDSSDSSLKGRFLASIHESFTFPMNYSTISKSARISCIKAFSVCPNTCFLSIFDNASSLHIYELTLNSFKLTYIHSLQTLIPEERYYKILDFVNTWSFKKKNQKGQLDYIFISTGRRPEKNQEKKETSPAPQNQLTKESPEQDPSQNTDLSPPSPTEPPIPNSLYRLSLSIF